MRLSFEGALEEKSFTLLTVISGRLLIPADKFPKARENRACGFF